MTAEKIAELKRLAAAATPGPWESVTILPAGERRTPSGGWESWGESPWRIINGPPQTISDNMLCRRAFTHAVDTEFIAALRNNADALIDGAERDARREVDVDDAILALDKLADLLADSEDLQVKQTPVVHRLNEIIDQLSKEKR